MERLKPAVWPRSEFWSGKKVLLTGHTGFKGSWLSVWLREMGAQVTGFALRPHTDPSMFFALGLENLIPNQYGDVRDVNLLRASVQKVQPDIVIHMAAQTLVLPSYADPQTTFDINVMGTVNLLEACRSTGSVRVIINVTTDKVYENEELGRAFKESDRLGGHDPYSNSKACSELVSQCYRLSFMNQLGVKLITCRSGNVVGGGDWSLHRLIPDCVRSFSMGEPVVIRSPNSVRPWQHVLEPLRGYLIAAERAWEPSALTHWAWNFGPRAADFATVEDVLSRLIRHWPQVANWNKDRSSTPVHHEATLLSLDSQQADIELNWRPLISLDKGIELTAKWYRKFYEQAEAPSLYGLTVEQIGEIADRARQ